MYSVFCLKLRPSAAQDFNLQPATINQAFMNRIVTRNVYRKRLETTLGRGVSVGPKCPALSQLSPLLQCSNVSADCETRHYPAPASIYLATRDWLLDTVWIYSDNYHSPWVTGVPGSVICHPGYNDQNRREQLVLVKLDKSQELSN